MFHWPAAAETLAVPKGSKGPRHHQRAEQKFSRTERARADVSGVAAYRGSERRRRLHCRVRGESRTGIHNRLKADVPLLTKAVFRTAIWRPLKLGCSGLKPSRFGLGPAIRRLPGKKPFLSATFPNFCGPAAEPKEPPISNHILSGCTLYVIVQSVYCVD